MLLLLQHSVTDKFEYLILGFLGSAMFIGAIAGSGFASYISDAGHVRFWYYITASIPSLVLAFLAFAFLRGNSVTDHNYVCLAIG